MGKTKLATLLVPQIILHAFQGDGMWPLELVEKPATRQYLKRKFRESV
jgi:hypothetical protein